MNCTLTTGHTEVANALLRESPGPYSFAFSNSRISLWIFLHNFLFGIVAKWNDFI